MERELEINLTLNRREAEAQARAFADSEKQRIQSTTGAHAAAEATRTAATTQAAKQRVDATNAAGQAEAQTEARLLTAVEVAERAKAAIIERTNRQRVDAAVRAETKEEQLLTQLLTKEQVTFRARDALVARHNQQRIDAELKAMDASQKGWLGTDSAITKAGMAVGSFAVQMVGLNSAQAIIGTIAEQFDKARHEAMEATKFVQGYREALLELAALKGHLGETSEELKQDLDFRRKTLQTPQESTAFQEAALGVGESAIDKGQFKKSIAPEEFKKLMELAGSFQVLEHGDAATHGRLAGQIPSLMGKRTTGEEAFAKEQQLYEIFKPGGGKFSQLTNQFLQQAPLVTSGVFDDPAKMAGLLSAFSVTNPEGAGTNVQQFTRATVGGLGRTGAPRIEGDVEKYGHYLKGLGATNQMDPIEIGKLISADFTKQEEIAASKGEKFNAMDYTKHKGMMNQEDIMSLLAFHGLNKTGQFQQTFEPLMAAKPDATAATKQIEERQRVEPVAQSRLAKLAGDEAQIRKASGGNEALDPLKRAAFANLSGDEKSGVTGSYEEVMGRAWYNPTEFMFSYKDRVNNEAQRMALEEAKRLGMPVEDDSLLFRQSSPNQKTPQVYMGDEKLAQMQVEIQARKGNAVLSGTAESHEATVGELNKQTQLLQQIRDRLDRDAGDRKSPPIVGRPQVQTR